MRWQVRHSKVRISKPRLPVEIWANPILCLQAWHDGRPAMKDVICVTLPLLRRVGFARKYSTDYNRENAWQLDRAQLSLRSSVVL